MRAYRLLFASLLCFLAVLGRALAAPDTVWISSLDLSQVVQGWGQPQVDKSVTGTPLSIAGQKFAHGLGTHADSLLRLDLHGRAKRFSAFVGVDDNAHTSPEGIVFKVTGDKGLLFQSPAMRLGQAAIKIDLDVSGMHTLLLQADAAGGNISFAHADWAEAQVTYHGTKPAIAGPPHEEAIILTPKPPHEPRINGPRVYGAHPGHPFLYTIPVTGDRPMTFGVIGLPASLAIDAQSGQITGTTPEPGDYSVTFTVENHLGRATKQFEIISGETLALTPYMGWNSWYVWEGRVTDKIMRDAADAMVSTGLINHGFQYVNIDDCWAVKPGSDDPTLGGPARDPNGMVNANKRFPDMKALTDYIHSKGLKAGIYTSPGPRTCAGFEGAYGHELLDAERFASWGFDFLKYDWCSYGREARDSSLAELEKPYKLMGDILRQQDRDLILNFCQYGMGDVWMWGKSVGGQSWRTAGDLGGSFKGIPVALFRDAFDLYSRARLDKYGGPGGWNDPDYLLLGRLSNWKGSESPTPLTPNEQYSHVSLWCLVAAPLILSGDITHLDDFTLSLLSNDEVLAVDQDALGHPGHRASQDGTAEVWVRDLEGGDKAVGLFNRGETPAPAVARWEHLGLTGRHAVRDLWRQKNLGHYNGEFKATVPRHGVLLIRISGP